MIAGGGRPPDDNGYYLNPALIGNVDNGDEICQEELFGPIGVLLAYDTVDDAVTMANDTRFGLNANVWGETDEATSVALRLRSGTVTVNGGGPEIPEAPWPGLGESGYGVDRGTEGFKEFFNVRYLQVPLGAKPRR